MKAYPFLVLSILVAGCASSPTAMAPKTDSNFRRPVQNPQYVEFVGDWESIGLLAYANNPHWKCTICNPGATSTDLLAALPTVIALHPDAIHILTGDLEVGYPNPITGVIPLENIAAMVTKIQAAKIPIVIGLLPPVDESPSELNYRLNVGLLFDYTDVYGGPPYIALLPVIDYADINAVFDVDPDSAVYAAMLPLTEAAIDDLGVSSKGVTGKVYGLPATGLRR